MYLNADSSKHPRLRHYARPYHLLITPQETLERTIGLIKGGFSLRLSSKLPVWQRGFTDHRIRDAADYSIRHRYIHQNPVTARLCDTPKAYPFSSAHSVLQLDMYSPR